MPNPASYFLGSSFYQKPAPAALPSSTPPVFAGIVSTTPNNDGSISLSWAAGSTVNPPISYKVYVALGSVNAATLFTSGNLQKIVPAGNTSTKVFLLGDQTTFLVNGNQYTFGVRAQDAYGNAETNVVLSVATAISSGNLATILQSISTSLAATDASIAASASNISSSATDIDDASSVITQAASIVITSVV